MTVFISDRIDDERLYRPMDDKIFYGRAHYSWKIIARLYRLGLERSGYQVRDLLAPDIYQTDAAKACAGIAAEDVHIAVKPIEHIRPLFGNRNFFISGWEFPEFSTTPYDDNPGNDFVGVLRQADRVLCWSSFTAGNLHLAGVPQAVVLPPPVVALFDRGEGAPLHGRLLFPLERPAPGAAPRHVLLTEVTSGNDTLFLTVMNPNDMRKNISALIREFAAFTRDRPASRALIVKLVVDNVVTTLLDVFDMLRDGLDISDECPQIFFTSDLLSPEELLSLYRAADFYVCPSSTEGLNLPLIEAISCGAVAISSMATAMADYIRPDNAIVLATEQKPAGPRFSSLGSHLALTHFPPVSGSLYTAFIAAEAMPRATRAQLAKAAEQVVSEQYGLVRFGARFGATLAGRDAAAA